ncbi:BTAD domain-containing putative transcriptional regulator [Armatimonas sp.]|uniref:BTAD domain-containing putative transcriptional regulator n=1 Tax=Armatimonas sp. TaxID=1872638 RepID=UPI00374CDD1F
MSGEVRLLGRLSVAQGDEVVTHFRTQKTAALLAFLAFHSGNSQSREELIERFWPESELEQGRMSLRTALSALRKLFGERLTTDNTTAMLSVNTDHARFERALRAARSERLAETERLERLSEAVEIYGGPLLPGFYEDWVLHERDRLAAAQVAALAALARWHAALREIPKALDYARRAAAADPLNEEIRADLIRLLRKANRPGEALRQFQDLEKLLDEQLAQKPSASTAALVEGLETPDTSIPEPQTIARLPLTLGRFRGRRDELAALVQRLSGGKSDADGARLFTLFGSGGIGKTRLAVEAGRRLAAHQFFATLHFVPLAGVTTVPQAWEMLAGKLGLHGGTPSERVRNYLSTHTPALLILDNLEQFLPEGAALVESLLAFAPDLTILTTSRQRLAIPGEELFVVGALPEDDSVALFVDRARSISPDFKLTQSNELSVRELVRSVEGFPLAIELAAAWAGTLTPTEMVQQLAQSRLNLPKDSQKDPRHASLTAAISWSTELLEPELRETFYRLAVFQGGWDALAAQVVCGAGNYVLASLRDRALVSAELQGTSLRFFLHESLREFSWHSLSPVEQTRLNALHRAHFLQRAKEAKLDQPRGEIWAAALAHLIPDEANLRKAQEGAAPTDKVRFVLALLPLWLHQGRFNEGELACRVAGEVIGSEEPDYLLLRFAAATLAYNLNKNADAERGFREVVEKGEGTLRTRALLSLAQLALFNQDNAAMMHTWLARIDPESSTPICSAHARFLEGTALLYQGETAAATEILADAGVKAQSAGELALMAQALNNQGNALHQAGELEKARQSYTQALVLRETLGLRVETLRTRIGLANVEVASGDLKEALSRFRQASQEAAAMGDLHIEALVLGNQAAVLQELGNSVESLVLARRSLMRKQQLGLSGNIATSLNNIAGTLLALGRTEAVASLHGAAEMVRRNAAITLGPAFREQLNAEHANARHILGDSDFTAGFGVGTTLSEQEAVALALAD